MEIYQTSITGDMTVLYIGLAFFLVLFAISFAISFFLFVMANYKKREAIKTNYIAYINAFKIGLIKKTADEEKIELIFTSESLIDKLKEEVANDLSK